MGCKAFANPLGGLPLGHVTGGYSHHEFNGLYPIEHKRPIVDCYKQAPDHPSGTLIAIVESVSCNDAIDIGGSKVCYIRRWISIGSEVCSPIVWGGVA